MEYRQLRYVIQIAAEKNFSRAAEKLHIAQPSLSQQLSKLEKELGVLLFKRSTNAVELTHAGEVFVEKAQHILDLTEQLTKEMEDMSQMKRGKLVVGSLPITGSHILPIVLPAFKQRFPEIEVALVEETSNQLEILSAQGKTDVTLLTLPLQDSSLAYEELIQEEVWLALPQNHPLLDKYAPFEEPVPFSELQNEPFIALKKGQGFRQITFDLCASYGFTPQIVFESSNIETVQSLVAAGMGIAFVPEMIARTQRSHFVPQFVTLEGRPYRTIVVAHRKGRYVSKAAEMFISTLKTVLKNSVSQLRH
ncbi:LysR family transcriptional regulator [Marinicrinis lubricantis]|uniref:LysR family transcriptional regulator n=1 Tax=Marinicrinis lubricantis TaxID=2086470 RepID=A0ABW1ILY2_9BACL